MRAFGLTPDDVLARTPASAIRPWSAGASIVQGAVSVGVVSVAAYTVWAFQLISNTAAMYTATAVVYLGLTPLALSRLVLGNQVRARFAGLFATGFAAYAVLWCACWFGLRGKHHADLWAAVVGLAAMAWIFQRAFGQTKNFLLPFAVLFTFHTLGFTLGDELHVTVPGTYGRLLWGAAHGLGFGAGLGYVLFHCQSELRARIASV